MRHLTCSLREVQQTGELGSFVGTFQQKNKRITITFNIGSFYKLLCFSQETKEETLQKSLLRGNLTVSPI